MQLKNIGRRIYFVIDSGEVILDTGEKSGIVVPLTVDQEIESYAALLERTRQTFDYIELEYKQFAQDFTESNAFRVNPETKQLEFSYPDPNAPTTEPVYQKPISQEITELKAESDLLKSSVLEMTTYATTQDSRLALQEQATLELTTLIAGGNV